MEQEDKQRLKRKIQEERGYWHPFHEYLLEWRPGFLAAYLDFQQEPIRSGVLERKLCEFIYIAIDASVNHMYARGAQRHMGFALENGATEDELLQVLLITSVLSARQPVRRGMAMLEELASEGGQLDPGADETVTRLERSTSAYEVAIGENSPLSKKYTALIGLAICAAPTCLDEHDMRAFMAEALDEGASQAEIAAVLQLCAALAVHTCTIGIPALQAALRGDPVD